MREAVGELVTHRILLYFVLLAIMFLIGAIVLSTLFHGEQSATPQATAMQTASVSVTPDSGQADVNSLAQITPTIALATPWGVLGLDGTRADAVDDLPTPATPLPELPPIVLLGPPPDSQFRQGDFVTFYWDWPEVLSDGRRYSVYLQGDGGSLWVGAAEADNLGTAQQLGVNLNELSVQAGNYQWVVVVEETDSGTVLARSEQRPIVVIADTNR